MIRNLLAYLAAHVLAYLATGLTFLLFDAGFLSLAGPRLYRPDLDPILGDGVRLAPAALFYALYIAGMTVFCVAPAVGAWPRALARGLMLGLVAYGTYDLTCQSVMRVWSWRITLVDLAWGAFASAVAASAGALAVSRLQARP